jgi:hypothetical protein
MDGEESTGAPVWSTGVSGNGMLEKGVWATGEIRAVGIATRTSRKGTDGAEVGGGHSTEEAG